MRKFITTFSNTQAATSLPDAEVREESKRKASRGQIKNPTQQNSEENPHGLRGGGRSESPSSTQQGQNHHLQLINPRNDCFVNAVVQLLSLTD